VAVIFLKVVRGVFEGISCYSGLARRFGDLDCSWGSMINIDKLIKNDKG
jgi:hypothetical protein